MDLPAIGVGVTGVVAICTLIAWIAFLITCIVIVKIGKGTEGLKDFAAAVKAYRSTFGLRGKKQDEAIDDAQAKAELSSERQES